MRLFLYRENNNTNKLQDKPILLSIMDSGLSMILALVFSLSWTYVFLSNLDVSFKLGSQALIQILVMLIMAFLLYWPKIAAIGLPFIAVLSLLSFVINLPFFEKIQYFYQNLASNLGDAFLWTFETTQDGITMPPAYPIYIGILAAGLAYFFVWHKPLAFVLSFITLIPFFASQAKPEVEATYIVALALCLGIVALVFSREAKLREKKRFFASPPVVLVVILLLITFFLQGLVGPNFFQIPALADYIRQIQKRINSPQIVNYFEFSLREAGYYPTSTSLGGPMTLSQQLFMVVEGPANSFRLRGSIADEYTGSLWLGSDMEPNYIFDNKATQGKQAQVYDYPALNRNSEAYIDQFFTKQSFSITPIRLPIQVVFNGGKPQYIDETNTPEQVYYYNDSGQIYAGLEIKEAYEVEGYIQKEMSANTTYNSIVQGLESKQLDINLKAPNEDYKSIVERQDPDLAEIIYGRTPRSPVDAIRQLEKVESYLEDNYKYELQVTYPDPNLDFLEHFLKEKEGYCTYFATALTLFARELGLDARYVEGFLVPAVDQNVYPNTGDRYSREVLSDMAHAWTEIYINGLGWLALEATPANVISSMTNEEGSEEPNDEQTPPEESSEESSSEETTTETSADARAETTTPPPTIPQDQNQPTEPPPLDKPPAEPPKPPTPLWLKSLFKILGMLILLIITLVLYWRWAKSRYVRRHDHDHLFEQISERGQGEVLEQIWSDIKTIYGHTGSSFEANRTLLQRFKELDRTFPTGIQTGSYPVYLAFEKSFYAEENLSEHELALVFNYYESLEHQLKDNMPKAKWWLKRFLWPDKTAKF